MDAKERIIKTSLELFNKDGVRKTTTNHIAKAVGISPGNLYYHFKNKEEIILEIFGHLAKELDHNWEISDTDNLQKNFSDMFSRLMRFQYEYRFFYYDLNTLIGNDDNLRIKYLSLMAKRKAELDQLLRLVHAEGIFTEELLPRIPTLVEHIWFITEYWLAYQALLQNRIDQKSITEAITMMLNQLKPYLTEKGCEMFSDIDPVKGRYE